MSKAEHESFVVTLVEALLSMDAEAVGDVLKAAGSEGTGNTGDLTDGLIVPALTEVGDRWESGEAALSQVYMSARILEKQLTVTTAKAGAVSRSKVVGLGVLEDYHALGKSIVRAVLRTAGFDVRDLGTGLSIEQMVAAVAREKVDVLMVSVLMYNKALHVARLVESLAEHGLGHIPVVVGGAPFRHDRDLWREVGADAMGLRASDAVGLASTKKGGVL